MKVQQNGEGKSQKKHDKNLQCENCHTKVKNDKIRIGRARKREKKRERRRERKKESKSAKLKTK